MIAFDADLNITGQDFSVDLYCEKEELIVSIAGSRVPRFPLSSIRQLFRSRSLLNRLGQDVRVLYEGKPILAIRNQSFKILNVVRFTRLFVRSQF